MARRKKWRPIASVKPKTVLLKSLSSNNVSIQIHSLLTIWKLLKYLTSEQLALLCEFVIESPQKYHLMQI